MSSATQILHTEIQCLIKELPYKEYIPDNVLHIGVRSGSWISKWSYVFKYIDLVGIELFDYVPIEHVEGVNEQNFPNLCSHKYQFIQGNPIEKQFANTIKTNFDIIAQECHYYTQEEILSIYQNFFSKCNTLYVIQGIRSEEQLRFLKKNIHTAYQVKREAVKNRNDRTIIERSIIIKKNYDK